jgi:phage tail-like protein
MDAASISKLLPEVFRETHQAGSVLDAILAVMEAFTSPTESALSSLDSWFDPRRAPDEFLIMLATWVALGPYVDDAGRAARDGWSRSSLDSGSLRELVCRGATLARLRGTRSTLIAMLQIATGVGGFDVVENPPGENGQPQPFSFHVHAPAAAKAFDSIVSRIVEREKPAFITAEIVYAER